MRHTLYDKIWRDHVVHEEADGTCLLFVDRHLVQEVDSPQAFGGLRQSGRKVRSPERTLMVLDHNVRTKDRDKPNPDREAANQIAYFAENAEMFGIEYYGESDRRQGICHVSGPEQGFILRAPPSHAAIATPQRMARSAPSHSGLARVRSNTCSQPKR